MGFLIKICGVTTPDDAAMVAAAGADAIGINFWAGSKRFVGDDQAAARVIAAIPPSVLKVGVFVNAGAERVSDCLRDLGLDRVQLHGDERADDFAALPPERVMRAIRVRDADSLRAAAAWAGRATLFLCDADVASYGGGGVVAPWEVIATGPTPRPFLLAGGLTQANVAAAIAATAPDGVDVAGGVESAPGRKDATRVAAFVAAARATARAAAAARADAG